MRGGSLIDTSMHMRLSRMAIYVIFISWTMLGLYVLWTAQHKGFADIVGYLLSAKYRFLGLFAPLLLTVGYFFSERAKLCRKTVLAEKELQNRTIQLEEVNELLWKENNERKKAEEQVLCQAFYDSVTNLPNRTLLLEYLNKSLGRKKRYPDYMFAVFFLDVDRFKGINDGLGHLVGDQLLISLSQRLKKSMRSIDTVSRFGGDEFAILMDNIKDVSSVNDLADRIKEQMRMPFYIFGHEIFVSVSIGIALSDASDYSRPDELIRDADIAMSGAKSRGGACHVIFDSTMHAKATTAIWLETGLRKAPQKNELIVYYQPIISLENNKIIGFEALVRWQHPDRGLMLPADFMTIAEETGLIIPVDQWVIREACRQMKQWQDKFPSYRHLTVSVNISGSAFSQPDFCEAIEKIIHETGLPASCLRLEIVERALIENPELAATLLKRLKKLNIRFDIDDFGTGYSALNYLRHFPIDGLKIDRSFMNALTFDKNNLAIVQTIIALAQALKLDVIAEGIETTKQLELFRDMKGEYAQGFFIFEPMDCNAAENLLAAKIEKEAAYR